MPRRIASKAVLIACLLILTLNRCNCALINAMKQKNVQINSLTVQEEEGMIEMIYVNKLAKSKMIQVILTPAESYAHKIFMICSLLIGPPSTCTMKVALHHAFKDFKIEKMAYVQKKIVNCD